MAMQYNTNYGYGYTMSHWYTMYNILCLHFILWSSSGYSMNLGYTMDFSSEVQIVLAAGQELPSRFGDQQYDFKGKSRSFCPK